MKTWQSNVNLLGRKNGMLFNWEKNTSTDIEANTVLMIQASRSLKNMRSKLWEGVSQVLNLIEGRMKWKFCFCQIFHLRQCCRIQKACVVLSKKLYIKKLEGFCETRAVQNNEVAKCSGVCSSVQYNCEDRSKELDKNDWLKTVERNCEQRAH